MARWPLKTTCITWEQVLRQNLKLQDMKWLSQTGSVSTVHNGDISTEASPFTTDLIKYPCTAFKKPQEELKLNWKSAFGNTTLVFSDLSKKPKPVNSPLSPAGSHLNSLATEQRLYKYNVCQGTISPNDASGGWQEKTAELSNGESLASCSHPSKKMRIDHSPLPSNNAHDGTPTPGWVNVSWLFMSQFIIRQVFLQLQVDEEDKKAPDCGIFNTPLLKKFPLINCHGRTPRKDKIISKLCHAWWKEVVCRLMRETWRVFPRFIFSFVSKLIRLFPHLCQSAQNRCEKRQLLHSFHSQRPLLCIPSSSSCSPIGPQGGRE